MDRSIPYLSLTDTTNEYMLATLNDRRKYFLNYLSHAKWIWKSLLWNTLWAVKHKYIEVDCTTSPHSIPIPKDMVRFINLSVIDDCDKMRSLSFDENMNVLPPPATKNVCSQCGESDVLGQCVNDITIIQKNVVIDNETFVEKIWKKVYANGDMVEIRQVPVKKYDTAESASEYEITYETIERHICKLETKPCGCIKATDENKTLITEHCGCMFNGCFGKLCDTTFAKKNAKFGAMKIQDGRIWVRNNTYKQLILSYQTNGDCNDSELMIPEYAVNAIIFGIDYRAKALAPGYDRFEKKEAERAWNRAQQELLEFLNPIIMTEFMNAQMALPLWGYSGNQTHMKDDSQATMEIAHNQGVSVADLSELLDKKLENINTGNTIINNNGGGGEIWQGDW